MMVRNVKISECHFSRTPCMRKASEFAVVALAVLAGLAIAATVLSCSGKKTTIITRSHAGVVGDDEALRLSREALRRVVKDFVDYEARPYNGADFFATNVYDS